MEFEFDLTSEPTKTSIEIVAEKEIVKKINTIPINKLDDLRRNPQARGEVEKILWHNKTASNVSIIERLIEDYSFNEVLATNLVMIHRPAYLNFPNCYTIFDLNRKRSTFTKKSMRFFNSAYEKI